MRATIGKRFGAMFIDWLLTFVFSVLIALIFIGSIAGSVLGGGVGGVAAATSSAMLMNIIVIAGWTAYYLYFYSTSGQTLGKRAVGVRVVRRDGRPLDVNTGLRRVAVIGAYNYVSLILGFITMGSLATSRSPFDFAGLGMISLILWIFRLLDYLWAFWDAEQQTLHDKFADTLVVDA